MKKILLFILLLSLLRKQPSYALSQTSILGLEELLEEGDVESVVSIANAMLEVMRPEPPADIRWLCFATDGYRYLYEAMYPTEDFDIIDYDVVNVLYLKAYAHFDLEQYPQAIQALKEGLLWDPVGLQLRFELLHNYQQLHMEEQLTEERQSLWSLLLYLEDFALFYRFLGSSLVDSDEREMARAYLLFSLRFEDSSAARNELSYLDEQLQKNLLDSLSQAESKELLLTEAEAMVTAEGWGFSLGASQRAALQRQAQEEAAKGASGIATQSLELYQRLLPALPPQAEPAS